MGSAIIAPPGGVATARPIGVLKVEQKDCGKPWASNDRFFAVATDAHTHQTLKRLENLGPHLLPVRYSPSVGQVWQ